MKLFGGEFKCCLGFFFKFMIVFDLFFVEIGLSELVDDYVVM